MFKRAVLLTGLLAGIAGPAQAELSAEELAKLAQNPAGHPGVGQ